MNMKSVVLVLALLSLLTVVPGFSAENDYNPQILAFPIGTTNAGSSAASIVTAVLPANITITSVYVVDRGGVATDATDTVTIDLLDDGDVKSTYVTSTAALVAATPKAMTITAANARIAKSSVVTARCTKGGSGQATTDLLLVITYFNGW